MKGNWIGRLGTRLAGPLLLLAALSAFACAQDFPTLKGDANRTGKSALPNANGPGAGLLTWFHPNLTDGAGKTMTVDNTTMATGTDPDYVAKTGIWFPQIWQAKRRILSFPTDTFAPPVGVTYTVTTTVTAGASGATQTLGDTAGIVPGDTLHFATAGVDAVVTSVTDQVTVVLATSVASTTGETVTVTTLPRPDYLYATAIASDTSGDQRVPLNPGTDTLSTFSWILRNPTTPFYEGQSYALYAYLPDRADDHSRRTAFSSTLLRY